MSRECNSIRINKEAKKFNAVPCFEGSIGEGDQQMRLWSFGNVADHTGIHLAVETNGDPILEGDSEFEHALDMFRAEGFTA